LRRFNFGAFLVADFVPFNSLTLLLLIIRIGKRLGQADGRKRANGSQGERW
jgi:hypothetical protein